MLLFVDDSTQSKQGRALDDIFRDANDILSAAKIWFSVNMLQLNEDKTELSLFTLKHDTLEDVEAVKLLSFWLDPKFS